MATQEELLAHLWNTIINAQLNTAGLERVIAYDKKRPGDPFSDVGPAIERVLAAGVSAQDLCLINRFTAYEAVFGTLYALGDPGLDEGDICSLYESLLTADPSGMDGRPGSADGAWRSS